MSAPGPPGEIPGPPGEIPCPYCGGSVTVQHPAPGIWAISGGTPGCEGCERCKARLELGLGAEW